jgi:DNA-binding NarL/FixJ family response regulator
MDEPTLTREKPIRLVLIEDHADFRESVSMVLEERGGYQCVGGFSTMEDALEALRGGLVADLVPTSASPA